jgi:pyruvate dehydrogenase E2 component (dihydrolipoamide acetyltransferase)
VPESVTVLPWRERRRRRARRSGGAFLSPAVRRLVAERAVDVESLVGTGDGGRVTRDDLLTRVAAEELDQDRDRDLIVPFSPIRRRTAEHMVRSKATAAHAAIVTEVDLENVARVRARLSYLPFIVRAVVDALTEYPRVNATVGDDELVVRGEINLGIAVDLDHEGLIVPVIRDAPAKRLRALAGEIADLAERARARRLSPDDVAGGTFTITNPGPYGTFASVPIINQPQVAILATDRVTRRPVVVSTVDGDGIAVHAVGRLVLSFDHRAFDGAYAAAFLARVRDILETRPWDVEL